jgi:hypothetical protein
MRGWGIVIIAAGVLLAGCGSAESGTARPLSTTFGRTGDTSSTEASSPAAVDGANVAACSDTTCEVSVGPGTAIPLPASTGVQDVKVTTVTRDRVTLTGKDTGNGSFGSCTGQCDSNDIDGVFTITLGPGAEDIQNEVSVVVEGFVGGNVVLKFAVAR